MGAEFREYFRWERAGVGRGHVGSHVTNVAHAGNDSRDSRGREAESQGEHWEFVEDDAGVADDGLDRVPHFLFTIAAEIVVAKVASRKLGVGREFAGQRALVEGHTHDYANAVLFAGQERVRLPGIGRRCCR